MFADVRQFFLAKESSNVETCLNTEQYKSSHVFAPRAAQILAV